MKNKPDKESGFALVLGLIFVLVASMSAVTLMRGSVMQEQMTANMNHKAISFMAAEAGANKLVRKLPKDEGDAVIDGDFGSNGRYETKVKSFIDNVFVVEVTGKAVSGAQVLATTTIEISFSLPSPSPSSGGLKLPSVINLGGNVKDFKPASSEKFAKNSPGLIITVQNKSDFDSVNGSVTGSKMCDDPCVVEEKLGVPWSDAEKLMAFVDSLRGNSQVNFVGKDADTDKGKDKKRLNPEQPITVVELGASLDGNQGEYEGVIIFLGENINLNGLGKSIIRGSIYAANPIRQKNEDGSYDAYEFGEMSVIMNGGGNGTLVYDSQAGASVLPPSNSNPEATITSWRETI